MATKQLVTELQSLGLRIQEGLLQRKGGAGPAEGGTIVIHGQAVSVPVSGHYLSHSPYTLERTENKYRIYKNGEFRSTVELISRPAFYELQTSEGVPYKKIALLHGRDCLATTVLQTCDHWQFQRQCRFCGIEVSLRNQSTLPIKTPEQLAEVAWKAKELDGIRQVVLTTGASSLPGDEVKLLSRCATAIKRATGLAVHAQCLPPPEPKSLVLLKTAGVDTIGLHIESFDETVLAATAPTKAVIGLKGYLRAWKEAVELFGPNQVSSFLIAGLGEKKESILQGSALLADLGVYPFIVPLRPIPGSLMENTRPPQPAVMAEIYEAVAEILKNRGIASSKSLAGCVRCGACSALPFYERPAEALICHPVRTQKEGDRAAAVRHQVFVVEQRLFPETDRDDDDPKSIHLVAEAEGQIVGTVRIFPVENNGHWIGGRLAIQKEFRFSGAGERLVREAVAQVKGKGCTRFSAHIQRENVHFFTRLGWKPVGPVFEFRGKPHQLMKADLQGDEK